MSIILLVQRDEPNHLDYHSTLPPDPAAVWPARRRAVIQWSCAIVAVWEIMVLLALNVASAAPKPTWLILLALLVGPVLLALMLWPYLGWGEREHRKVAGLCLKCGYSLVGNVSGTCPECGASVVVDPPL